MDKDLAANTGGKQASKGGGRSKPHAHSMLPGGQSIYRGSGP
jgi:hypothetical protein